MTDHTKASLILRNGTILTLNENTPQAESLAIHGSRIIAVGQEDEIGTLMGPNTKIEDLNGFTVLPGLVDSHIHLEQFVLNSAKIDCEVSTIEACVELVHQRAVETPPGTWILGHGWNQNLWERFGTASDLDEVAPNHPVYLSAKSLHAGWANSTALRQAGLSKQTTDPPGGQIQRDPDGNPTGILFEGAIPLVTGAIPTPTPKEIAEKLLRSQEILWRFGITALHDFDGAACLQALQILRDRNQLGLRIVKNIAVADLESALNLGLRSGFGDHWIRIGNVKAFADGALGHRTASMLMPYNGEPNNTGMIVTPQEDLYETAIRAAEGGLGMAIHAIGDGANHEVINTFERVRKYETANNLSPLRHRIEHVQLLHPDDILRLSELNLIASMQPIHATSDMLMADQFWGKRTRHAYAWRSLIQAGTQLVFGSDAPVESPNPFLGLHAAVTRQRVDGYPSSEGWIPEEKISLLEALRAFTQSPADAAGVGESMGSLGSNYLADLIVLEKNPLTCDPHSLHEVAPVGTMVHGEWRFRAF